MARHHAVAWFCAALGLGGLLPALGQDRTWQGQLGFTGGSDSNVFESFDNPTPTYLGRLHLGLSGTLRPHRRILITWDGQVGVEGYTQYASENRVLGDYTLRMDLWPATSLRLGLGLRFRNKRFLTVDRGYTLPLATLDASLPFNSSWMATAYGQLGRMDHAQGTLYDDDHWEVGLKLLWAATDRIRIEWRGAAGTQQYQRQALDWNPELIENGPWIYRRENQRDQTWRAACRVEYYRNLLLRLGVGVEQIRSNSLGFSAKQPFIQLSAAREFSARTLLTLHWTWRGKYYDDPLDPNLKLRPDTESEEMNRAVIELSREVSSRTLLCAQLGWYQNESPYRNQYYQKTLLGLGLRLRL